MLESNAERLLGVFAEEHLPVRLQGTEGRTAEQPDPSFLNGIHWALGDVDLPEPMECEPTHTRMPSNLNFAEDS